MRCDAEFYYVGKISRIAIGRPSMQRRVVLQEAQLSQRGSEMPRVVEYFG